MLSHVLSQKNVTEQFVAECETRIDAAGPYLTGRGITKQMAVAGRLGVSSDRRLVIPYLTMTGPITYKLRCIQEHECKEFGHPKYVAQDDVPPLLYGTHNLMRDEDVLVVTEGELDALVWSEGLGVPAVAYPGVKNWRDTFARAIGPDWRHIAVVADGDAPGRDAARTVARKLRGRVLKLPDGEDTSSLLVKEGPEGLRARLARSVGDGGR